MQKRYGAQGLQIIGVNLDDNKSTADKFLRETPATFTLKFDPSGTLARKFDVQTMPSSYLLDASGNVIGKHFGFKVSDADTYEGKSEPPSRVTEQLEQLHSIQSLKERSPRP